MDGDDAKVTRVGPPGSGGPPAGRSFSAAFSARFEIQSTLGSGGMGVVYLAVDKSLDRPVAIKFSHAQDAEALARFAREGRVLARLRHPNLIQVYDTGEEGGHPFLVIEVAEGESLAERLERDGELEPLETLGFALQIAAGLVSAHGQGVLHRDLKCANILITSEGSIKICDFGLARTASVSDRVTTDGAFLGTPEYLAPELVEGAPASVASDLYAFGCVLTEMLTGLPPFPQQQKDGTSLSISDVVAAHLTKPIPIPSQRVPGIAPELDALVAACLAKKPSGRPKDATSVLAELEALERKEAVRSHVRLRAASGVRPRGSRVSASPAPTTLILSRPVDADATGPHSMVPPAASSSRRLLAGVAASLLLLGLSVLAA
ncbi:MAG: serine/threonine protein kinase, partial [Candidatus Wallbacteria bacterium]|nr:serine/threonine protein kinase [Candidatus Wallbacteria bacterium]